MLLFSLPNFKLSFIWLQTNGVAYLLGRAALSYASHHTFDCIPA